MRAKGMLMRIGSFKDLIREYRHVLFLLVYPLMFFAFYAVERIVPVGRYIMYSRLDDFIPFVDFMIVPYIAWYFYIGLTVAYKATVPYRGEPDRKGFYLYTFFLYFGMTSTCVIYVLWPNGQNLRPAVLGPGPFNDAIRWLYSVDTNSNVAPSIHVINSMATYFALKRDPRLGRNRPFQALNLLVNAVIIASTVMVKQHSIIDIVLGLAYSALLWAFVYKWDAPYRLITAMKRIFSARFRASDAGSVESEKRDDRKENA
jgi:membrane-associated phospholipid phosphatase